MLNGKHNNIDHKFTLDRKVFDKLFYLVDRIYPSLSQFLGSEHDPTTSLDGSFKDDQEAARKDVECGFDVWKLKFLALTHPINLHHRDDIYYLVVATILLHNMMVKECVSNDEIECASLYFNSKSNDDNTEEMEPEDS